MDLERIEILEHLKHYHAQQEGIEADIKEIKSIVSRIEDQQISLLEHIKLLRTDLDFRMGYLIGKMSKIENQLAQDDFQEQP